ncbi:MAG TPA: hypothetical protein VLJ13_11600, partial [Brevundimonas sp.]|nr:hypothetical protein [Brevundimonas sp.]
MQNPFNHNRPHEDQEREDRENPRWDARDQRHDEGRSWTEGDGGRTADAFRHQGREDRQMSGSRGMGYGQDQQSRYGEGMSRGWTGDRSQAGGGQGGQGAMGGMSGGAPYGPGPDQSQLRNQGYSQSYGQSYAQSQDGRDQGGSGYGAPSQGSGYSQGGAYGGSAMGGGSATGGGYGQGQRSHGQQGYSQHGYAPGGQIWEGSGRGMGGQSHEHHEFEPDYLHWRQQQLSAFDKDYTDWRNERR